MRILRWVVLGLLGLAALGVLALALAVGGTVVTVAWNSDGGDEIGRGHPTARAVPRPGAPANGGSQILFGDLHVHTGYSLDSELQNLAIADREPLRTPADACDFARFCSQLDFWSTNDHAESMTPAHWRLTAEAVRECNALAGDPNDPDLVTFLGWEWSHQTLDAKTSFGHKNVVLLGTEEGEIPTRPIASMAGPAWTFLLIGAVGPWVAERELSDFRSFHRRTMEHVRNPDCEPGVPVRELPPDCRESAETPDALFAKLDEWDLPAVVIPHGLSWGITNPPGARLDLQLDVHDPKRQTLLEIYSGHGNSEVYREIAEPEADGEGGWTCPEAVPGTTELCCQRAERLARERCEDPSSNACEASVERAVAQAASVEGTHFPPTGSVPGTTVDDWTGCRQLGDDEFLPAFNYRPGQSAQAALAYGSIDGVDTDRRFRFGFIGSSDTHRGRAGSGYKEFGRQIMTDGVSYPLPSGLLDRRDSGFFYTGGLAAVHAPARDRASIFGALERRHTYGTSGDRILLWFDWVGPDGATEPMGSEIESRDAPRFRVRALGAQKQKPGCPPFVHASLPAERIASLCLDECFHPSDERKAIERIEIVRIRPQQSGGEPLADRIDDPWHVIACSGDAAGCEGEVIDEEYAQLPTESAYYARAIQEPSAAVNGRPNRGCGLRGDGSPDDCLAPVGERAWSSPIFVQPE